MGESTAEKYRSLATNMISTKAVTNYEGLKHFLAAPKMVSFVSAASCKKDTIFGAARIFFGPSYFVTAFSKISTSPIFKYALVGGPCTS